MSDHSLSISSDNPVDYHCSTKYRPRVGGIILDNNYNLLIVKGKISNKWSLPKGALEFKENYIDGAIREIHEETGLKLTIINNDNHIPFWRINKGIIFLFHLNKYTPQLNPIDTNEIVSAKWLNLENINDVNHVLNTSNKMLSIAINKLRKKLYF